MISCQWSIIIESFELSRWLSYNTPMFIPSFIRWPLIKIMVVFIYIYVLLYFLPIIINYWLNDIEIESNEGRITLRVQKTIINGFKIFLISEIIIFISFIYVFIHFTFIFNIWLFMNFPPYGIIYVYPFGIPLANVLILFSSSLPLQALQLWIKRGVKSRTLENLGQLLSLVCLFLFFQLKEYNFTFFGISDSIYGTTF